MKRNLQRYHILYYPGLKKWFPFHILEVIRSETKLTKQSKIWNNTLSVKTETFRQINQAHAKHLCWSLCIWKTQISVLRKMLWCPEVVGYFKSQRHNIKLKKLNMIRFFILLEILPKPPFSLSNSKMQATLGPLERWLVHSSGCIQNLICSRFHRVCSSYSIQKLVCSNSSIIRSSERVSEGVFLKQQLAH